jgi:chromosome segregation ATPase
MSREHYSYYNADSILREQNREIRRLQNKVRQDEYKRSRIKQQQRFHQKQIEKLQRQDQKRQEQIHKMSIRMQKVEKNLSHKIDEVENRLSHKIRDLNVKIEQVHRELKQDISDLRQEIESREEHKKSVAQELLRDAKDALNMVNTYRHEKFKPGVYAKIEASLKTAEANYDGGIYEASIGKAQDVLTDAYELRAELMLLEEEWNEYRRKAFEATGEALVACEASMLVEYEFTGEDEKLHIQEVDIDYWSQGEMSALKNKLENAQSQIETSDEMNIEDFSQAIEESMQIQEQVTDIVEKAQDRYLLSQIRMDMAQDIEEKLYEDGYEVVDDTYEQEDPREPLWIKYENSNKDEVITIIKPRGDREVDIEYHYSSLDGDDSLYEQKAESIDERIAAATGVKKVHSECKDTPTDKHYEVLQMKTLDEVRKKGRS